MGAFFDSIHIRNKNADAVQKALEQIAKEAGCKFLIGPILNGWISVFPSDNGQNDEICAKIATLVSDDVFHLIVHDDDVFIYCFYRNGRLIDEYNSHPNYPDEDSEEEKQKCQGHPELFQDLLKPESLGKLKNLIAAEKFTFESERMAQFVKLLGLSNALASYDYLQAGDQDEDEIEGWKQFIHVENKPDSAEDYYNRGELKQAKDDLDGALADYDQAIEIKPDLAKARENRNLVRQSKGGSSETTTGANEGKIPITENSLALRTDFSDESAWKLLCVAIQESDNEFGFTANVDFISDPKFNGLKADQLHSLLLEDSALSFAFIIDHLALTHPDHPILAIDLQDEPGRTFRVVPSALWEVENNLSIANMGFDEFADAVDQNGVFRGFENK
jgi:tetratricopeptide (TPR) repeat protein